MASQKDKDYHMLRNPKQYGLKTEDTYGNFTKEGSEAHARFKQIWAKYGQKSMVGDKRRRNSTRKSNQKNKQILHQIERAQGKTQMRSHLTNEDLIIHTMCWAKATWLVFIN